MCTEMEHWHCLEMTFFLLPRKLLFEVFFTKKISQCMISVRQSPTCGIKETGLLSVGACETLLSLLRSCALPADLVSLWGSQMHSVSTLWVCYIIIWESFQQLAFLDPDSVLGLAATNIDLSINLYLSCFCRCTVTSTQLDHIAVSCPVQCWAFICFALKAIQTGFVLLFWNALAPFLDRL